MSASEPVLGASGAALSASVSGRSLADAAAASMCRPTVSPGQWLGLLGGGQLGRMFCMAAQSLGYRVLVLEPDPDAPAGDVADEHLCARYDDAEALAALAARCAAVTTEFENVPAATLERLAQRGAVRPPPAAVAIAQDRVAEKRFALAHGIACGPHALIRKAEDFAHLPVTLFPALLKTARLGYDGKGQAAVADAAAARAAWEPLGSVPCVLEHRLDLEREVSVLVCRAADGQVAVYPVAENQHRDGILHATLVPARLSAEQAQAAAAIGRALAEALDYVGVLCVELFVVAGADGPRLLFNEIAPRPHNSGHWTLDAAVASQFEQQARILAGLPLAAAAALAPAVMLNLLGDLWLADAGGAAREPDWCAVLADPQVKLHLYGKREPRRGRKMGHLTCLGATLADALDSAQRAAARLGLPPVA